jgi:hypothetical protein
MLGVRYRHSAIHIRMKYIRGNSCGIHIRSSIHNNAYMVNNKQWDTHNGVQHTMEYNRQHAYMGNNKQWDTHNGVQHTMEYNTQQHNGVQYTTPPSPIGEDQFIP